MMKRSEWSGISGMRDDDEMRHEEEGSECEEVLA